MKGVLKLEICKISVGPAPCAIASLDPSGRAGAAWESRSAKTNDLAVQSRLVTVEPGRPSEIGHAFILKF